METINQNRKKNRKQNRKQNRKLRVYIILMRNKYKKWAIETIARGSIIIPHSRFSEIEAENYCRNRNLLTSEECFRFKKIEIEVEDE